MIVARRVYIDTPELDMVIHQKRKGEDIRIFNVTIYLNDQDGDPIMHHKEKHIPESEYLDLRYLRDMAAQYPNTFPSEKYFTDVMKQLGVKLSSRVILYEAKAGQHYLSSRAYYCFSLMGHKNVQIVNGGMTKWLSEGRQTQG